MTNEEDKKIQATPTPATEGDETVREATGSESVPLTGTDTLAEDKE